MTCRRSSLIRVALIVLSVVTILGVAFAQTPTRYRIVVEAEHHNAIKASCAEVNGDSTASNGGYIWYPIKRPHATSENPAVKGDGGYALYKVKIPAKGQYYVWVRGWWQDGCGNSWFLVVDDGDPQTEGQDATYQTWKWRKASQAYTLSAGVHTFKLQDREDGARIDQILITNDARFQPVRAMAETADYLVK